MTDPLSRLALKHGCYGAEAFKFLFEALDQAVNLAGREEAQGADRHVSGQELLSGMRRYASQVFGPLAAEVWRSWGVHSSLDWGRIVFLLVDEGMLNRRENDTIEDFREDFDFDQIFVEQYVPELPSEFGPQPPSAAGG